MNNEIELIKRRYETVSQVIEKSLIRSGRNQAKVKIVVVSKNHSAETIKSALEVGIRDFGENYLEEGIQKIEAIGEIDNLAWHMIGHVQSRKADAVSSRFSFVHSVDSLKLASRLNRFAEQSNKILKILLEFNVSGEESKYGMIASDSNLWDQLLPNIFSISQLKNLEILGLMTMPPLSSSPNDNRSYFQKLVRLKGFINHNLNSNWNELSMGTSSDYSIAVEEGATIVRIGTAILGKRPGY